MGGLMWCIRGKAAVSLKPLPLRKWGQGQVCFFLDEPALLFPSFCPWSSSFCMILLASTPPWICPSPEIQRCGPSSLECKAINPVPKQQCDDEYDSSAAVSFIINSCSVLQFSLTFLTCVCAQRALALLFFSDLFGLWSVGWILYSSLER